MEQEDYSRIYEYESMGKKYAGEKACISLTSWRARINTVSKTLYSLIKMCPGFHIVLVLSKDEFPLMEKELPDNLMLFVENKLIELFWIRPNLKSFKKVLFTMDKYRDVPVISADDDCIYTCNYAQELYDKWKETNADYITYNLTPTGTEGPATLYSNKINLLKLSLLKMKTSDALINDDMIISKIIKDLSLSSNFCNKNRFDFPFKFHTTLNAINPSQYREKAYQKCLR